MSKYIIVCAVCAWLVWHVVAIFAETVKEGSAAACVAVVVPLGGCAGIKADPQRANN